MDPGAGRGLVLNALSSCVERSFKNMMSPTKSNKELAGLEMFFRGPTPRPSQ